MCLKILARFILSGLTFIFFFLHQGSLVLLLSQRKFESINKTLTSKNETGESINEILESINEWKSVTLLVVLFPYVASLLSQIWTSSFSTGGKWKEWPHWGSLLLGVISSVAESYMLTSLVWSYLWRIPGFLLLGVLNSGMIVPIFSTAMKNNTKTIRYIQTLLILVFTSCIIACFVLLVITGRMTTEESGLTLLFLIIISIIFTPKYQTFIHTTDDRGTQNSALLYIILKMLTCACSVYFLQHKSNTNELVSLKSFFDTLYLPNTKNIWICVSILLSSFLCQCVKYFNARTKVGRWVVHLPIYFSSIIMSILLVLTFSSVIDVSQIAWASSIGPSSKDIKVSADNFALYGTVAGLLILPILLDILNDRIIRPSEFSMYEAVLTTQHLLSRTYNTIKATPFSISANNKRNIRRVFICTTMYQESQIEMDRLLASIRNVSVSKLLRTENVVLESHIFLDNGADGQTIKQFGLQLLGLIEENLITDRDEGVMLYTPYGIQLSWKINNEMPLFVHLKDISKVNAKKRWSQVMYMKYVLNYRSSNFRKSSEENLSKNSSYGSLLSVESMDLSNEKRKATQNNLTVPDNKSKSLIKDNDSEVTSVETETTTVPYVEIFIGDTSSIENLSVKNELSNSIYTIADSQQIYHEDFAFDCEDYILATDADMTFVDTSIMDVLHMCESDPNVGAVCGRTRPKGVHIHPIVWLQMFDYAKDFWIIKSSQNIIGTVMCCPGCFSMYKLNAVRDVVDEYSGPVENMEDVFTKDNGEDRWMCTLLMLKGWKLRYSSNARNTTFCPEDTYEFMKQRRRWLLSDYANAVLVIRKLRALVSTNDAFSYLYAFYLLQLFLIMLLYPGSTIVMLCLGLELASGAPLVIVTPVIVAIVFAYCLMLLSEVKSTVQLIITKILIMVFGAGTCYIFVASTVIIFKDLAEGFESGHFERAEGFIVMIVLGSYIYGAMLYPTDIWILITGVVYLFFIPFLNMILPLYAMCNIVDQSWGTRDNQSATVPKFLHLPKIKRKMKKRRKLQQVDTTSLRSLSASSVSLSDYNQTEFEFWEELVSNVVGSTASKGLSNEDRILGLKRLRKKALIFFLIANLVCIIALVGLYAFVLQNISNKILFSIAMAVTLGLSPLIQISGSTVYRIDDTLIRIGRWVNNIT
ncbi:uncharacterized protein LOC134706559 [Mytilus trossulus]|uniref:uncharacterized protein LOC134706559 n=1 Tax=Mytilus trossulus TaxID=6551 RepID=UPI00300682A8